MQLSSSEHASATPLRAMTVCGVDENVALSVVKNTNTAL